MSCNRELYQIRLRIWLHQNEAMDFDEVNILSFEKMTDPKAQDIGCFRSLFTLVEKYKVFGAAVKVDPNPFHSNYFGRLITAVRNLDIFPAALLFIRRRDLPDDASAQPEIGVYMENIRIPLVIGGSAFLLAAETAEKRGF